MHFSSTIRAFLSAHPHFASDVGFAWLTLYHHTQCVGMSRPGVAVGECVGTDGVLDVRRLPA